MMKKLFYGILLYVVSMDFVFATPIKGSAHDRFLWELVKMIPIFHISIFILLLLTYNIVAYYISYKLQRDTSNKSKYTEFSSNFLTFKKQNKNSLYFQILYAISVFMVNFVIIGLSRDFWQNTFIIILILNTIFIFFYIYVISKIFSTGFFWTKALLKTFSLLISVFIFLILFLPYAFDAFNTRSIISFYTTLIITIMYGITIVIIISKKYIHKTKRFFSYTGKSVLIKGLIFLVLCIVPSIAITIEAQSSMRFHYDFLQYIFSMFWLYTTLVLIFGMPIFVEEKDNA